MQGDYWAKVCVRVAGSVPGDELSTLCRSDEDLDNLRIHHVSITQTMPCERVPSHLIVPHVGVALVVVIQEKLFVLRSIRQAEFFAGVTQLDVGFGCQGKQVVSNGVSRRELLAWESCLAVCLLCNAHGGSRMDAALLDFDAWHKFLDPIVGSLERPRKKAVEQNLEDPGTDKTHVTPTSGIHTRDDISGGVSENAQHACRQREHEVGGAHPEAVEVITRYHTPPLFSVRSIIKYPGTLKP